MENEDVFNRENSSKIIKTSRAQERSFLSGGNFFLRRHLLPQWLFFLFFLVGFPTKKD